MGGRHTSIPPFPSWPWGSPRVLQPRRPPSRSCF
jgi:hypothetical protein